MIHTPFPQLPPGFRFGSGTAALQVEGGADLEGRGVSIWDTFAAQPGRIKDGSTPAVTCDHYRRPDADIALMRELGTGGYRFSISWPRILPAGSGRVNQPGLDFYDRLVDKLLAAGQQPMATLYHWDLPQALEDDGGWLNPATVERFAEYAAVVGARLADRVEHWVPVNEPNVAALLGYGDGRMAPGKRLGFDSLWAVHHLLLGHGRAAIELRQAGAGSIGCANNHAPMWPASDADADVGATKLFDALWNGTFLEPMLLGRYPRDIQLLMEEIIGPGDLATIRQPLDFYGVNYYCPRRIAATGPDDELPFRFLDIVGYPITDIGWPVVPDALREWLILLRARYRAALPPIMITESGASYGVGPDADGVVDDQARIDYLDRYLRAVAEAIERGVDVRGFYAWTLIDNWAWTQGFTQRFGLVHVDHDTQVRTPKRSFDWFRELIAAQPASD